MNQGGTKQCFKCKAEKPLSSFYRHPQMKDGRLNKCKECTKCDAHQHRRDPKFREKVLDYDRRRGSRQAQEQIKAYRESRPLVAKAHSAVSYHTRSGNLSKPSHCAHCNSFGKVEGHHENYYEPLKVVWLCAACHRDLHSFYETVGRIIPGSHSEADSNVEQEQSSGAAI